jgi:8-oxo-dGTP diphosphatase
MPRILPDRAHTTPRRVRDSGRVTNIDPDHKLRCAERSCDVACVILVDARGWVLLQERDEHAPVAADQWGMVGGHVNPGEARPDAMRRELAEETGLTVPEDHLTLWYDGQHTPSRKTSPFLRDHWQIWAGRVDDVTDDDIVLGEGRQIVFVDPDSIDELPLAESTAYFLPLFLASDTYRELSGLPAR